MAKDRVLAAVTVLGGGLGAGKTTTLNHLLRAAAGRRIGVLVNDFGEANIDADLVVGVEGETVQLTGGCVCCPIRGDLMEALQQLLERPDPPEHIVIETSGVSDPKAVASTLEMAAKLGWAELDAVVTLVDAERWPTLGRREQIVAGAQIRAADVLVVNKSDVVDGPALEAVEAKLRKLAGRARLVRTSFGRVDPKVVLGIGAGLDLERDPLVPDPDHACGDDHAHGDHVDHGEVFTTVVYRTDKPMSSRRLRRAIDALAPSVVRAKGIVRIDGHDDRRAVLHVVGRRAELRLDSPWGPRPPATQIVCIAAADEIDEEAIVTRFAECEVEPGRAGPMRAAVAWMRARLS